MGNIMFENKIALTPLVTCVTIIFALIYAEVT